MAKSFKATPEELDFAQWALSTPNEQISVSEISDSNSNDYSALIQDAQNMTLAEETSVPWYQSYPAAAIKGITQGSEDVLRLLNPPREDPVGYFERLTGQNTNTPQLPSEMLNEVLPSNEGFIESSLQRAGRVFPALATGGARLAESALRSGIAGLSGAAAQQLGAPEWLQSLAELPAQLSPSFRNRMTANSVQQPLVEDARRLGLTDRQIAPLIQSERKQRVLSKIATRRGKTEQALSDSYDAVGRVYGELAARPESKQVLNQFQANRAVADIQDRLSNMPSELRNKIAEDLTDLVNKPITGESLINFYQDINYYAGRGDRQLGLLKEPVVAALSQLSPSLAADFNTTNRLYSNYHTIAKKLKPNIASDLVSGSEVARLLYGTFTGNYPLIVETVGETAARKMASELLLNPRFQNLSNQMVNALNDNKLGIAQTVLRSMIDLTSDVSPEASFLMQRMNFKDLSSKTQSTEQQRSKISSKAFESLI